MENSKTICAIIVAFNPIMSELKETIAILNQQRCDIIVVDNSPYELSELKQLPIVYQWVQGNKGIAFAQNQGVLYCQENKYQNIIFFDQDSKIPATFIFDMISFATNNRASIAAPIFYDEARGFEYAITHIDANGFRQKLYSNGSKEPFTSSVVISSGTLVKTTLFNTIGLMDESLFIDYVDTEWCLRCYKSGYLVFINPEAKMIHSIGNSSFSVFGFNIPVHSPARRYYRVRNSLKLLRYSHVPKLLALREIFFCAIHSLILIAHEKDKTNYLKSFLLGIKDGICNIEGENPRTYSGN
jgi:rhamnosyltransferase